MRRPASPALCRTTRLCREAEIDTMATLMSSSVFTIAASCAVEVAFAAGDFALLFSPCAFLSAAFRLWMLFAPCAPAPCTAGAEALAPSAPEVTDTLMSSFPPLWGIDFHFVIGHLGLTLRTALPYLYIIEAAPPGGRHMRAERFILTQKDTRGLR